MIIERAFSVESATRNILNQFAIRVKNGAIGTGKIHAVGMISQRLVAHPARHGSWRNVAMPPVNMHCRCDNGHVGP